MSDELRRELAALLNKYSRENESNTPDFILSNFLLDALDLLDSTIRVREAWYGRPLEGHPL